MRTMHYTLHPRDDIDTQYMSRKERGRGVASIEDSRKVSIQGFEDDIQKSKDSLITATRNSSDNIKIDRIKITRNQK